MAKAISKEQFITKAKQVHGDYTYDYSKVDYVNMRTKVCIICPEHGEFWQKPMAHLNGDGCKKCSKKYSPTTEEFIEKAKQTHGDKYDYSKVEYINNHTKIEVVCPEHGSFWITPNHHLKCVGCPKCAGVKKLTTEEFVEKAKQIHGDKYDYSKVEYINAYTKVCIICPKHGEFWQQPTHHLSGSGCQLCKTSKGEMRIELYLRANNINYIHDKACLDFLGKMRPDFYLPDYNLVIEYDGEQHSNPNSIYSIKNGFTNILENDKLKERLCMENNVGFLRIDYKDFKNIENILNESIII